MKKVIAVMIITIAMLLIPSIQPAQATGVVTQLRPVSVEDIPGQFMIGVARPQYIEAIVLTASSAATFTVPTGAKYVLFSANADFYANYTTTATVPSVSTSTGAASELNPALRYIEGVTSISLISPTVCIITIGVYK
jgi:hypothetical protein